MRYFDKEAALKIPKAVKGAVKAVKNAVPDEVRYIINPKGAKKDVLIQAGKTGSKIGRWAGLGGGIYVGVKDPRAALAPLLYTLAGGGIGRRVGALASLPKANAALKHYKNVQKGLAIGGGAAALAGGAVLVSRKKGK